MYKIYACNNWEDALSNRQFIFTKFQLYQQMLFKKYKSNLVLSVINTMKSDILFANLSYDWWLHEKMYQLEPWLFYFSNIEEKFENISSREYALNLLLISLEFRDVLFTFTASSISMSVPPPFHFIGSNTLELIRCTLLPFDISLIVYSSFWCRWNTTPGVSTLALHTLYGYVARGKYKVWFDFNMLLYPSDKFGSRYPPPVVH